MNYLAHFTIAERDASPVTAAASLLPDMLPYAGAVRRTHRVPAVPCPSPLWREICAGIQHHIDVDRAFHGSPWFDQRLAESLRWLREQDSPLAEHWSLWLLRHVTIELAIDGWLVRDDSTLTGRVYDALAVLAGDAAALAVLDAEFGTHGGLQRYLAGMLERPWLHVYAEPLGVANALKRVFCQLLARRPKLQAIHDGRDVFTPAEWAALPTFVDAVFAQVRASGDELWSQVLVSATPERPDT